MIRLISGAVECLWPIQHNHITSYCSCCVTLDLLLSDIFCRRRRESILPNRGHYGKLFLFLFCFFPTLGSDGLFV